MKQILPMEIEECICKHKEELWDKNNLKEKFPNTILRDDVFDVLGEFSTVVFFPLENDSNNGFRVDSMPFANGEKETFVYINTARGRVKEAFAAAHELGHIWNIDDLVIQKKGLEHTKEMREAIVNRFAACLLMPKDCFLALFEKEFDILKCDENEITYLNILKITVNLMRQFYVPKESVIYRFVELDILDEETAERLLGERDIPKDEIDEVTKKLLADCDCLELQGKSLKKWIDGLAEKLDIAEREGLIAKERIQKIRDLFGLKPAEIIEEMNEIVSLPSKEGTEK